MLSRVALPILIVLVIALAPVSGAQAGGTEEILLGFVFGTSFGLIFSGAITVFYTNPESDANIETVLITGGLIGATGGILLGYFIPDGAAKRDPVVSFLNPKSDAQVNWHLPTISLTQIQSDRRPQCGVFAQLVRFEF